MADFTPNRPRAYSNPNKRAIRQLLAAEACEPMARRMAAEHPDRFKFHPTTWGKFPDGTDKIIIGGYTPTNELAGEHVVLLCSFHNNDVTWSQFQVMIVLLQSFIESLTVVLPFSTQCENQPLTLHADGGASMAWGLAWSMPTRALI